MEKRSTVRRRFVAMAFGHAGVTVQYTSVLCIVVSSSRYAVRVFSKDICHYQVALGTLGGRLGRKFVRMGHNYVVTISTVDSVKSGVLLSGKRRVYCAGEGGGTLERRLRGGRRLVVTGVDGGGLPLAPRRCNGCCGVYSDLPFTFASVRVMFGRRGGTIS